MTDQERIKALEEKVQALEQIVSKSKIRLEDPNNPNKFLVLEFKDNTYKLFKETISVNEEMIVTE